ncbi:unnamed protein product, partial [Ectocarpus sp. 8 AP-2014]
GLLFLKRVFLRRPCGVIQRGGHSGSGSGASPPWLGEASRPLPLLGVLSQALKYQRHSEPTRAFLGRRLRGLGGRRRRRPGFPPRVGLGLAGGLLLRELLLLLRL